MTRRTTLVIWLVIWNCTLPTLHALDQKTISARTEHLRQMSIMERDRFNRNLQEFQKLSEVDKQRYRQLHQELLDDNARAGGLSKLLQTYAIWVQTLTPTQRDELQKETVPAQKLALIKRFKDEHEEPTESHEHSNAESHADDVAHHVSPPIVKGALSAKELKSVMSALVNRLPEEKVKPQFTEPQLSDYLPIIHASVQSSDTPYRDWPAATLLADITGAFGKDSTHLVNRPDYKSKRDATLRLVLMGIMKQAREIVRLPTHAEKTKILDDLNPVERERVMNLPQDRMNAYLVRKSLELKGGDAVNDFKKIRVYHDQIEDLFQRFEVSPPPGFVRGKKANERSSEPRGEGKQASPNRPAKSGDEK